MTNDNFNTIINRFKLAPNEGNYELAQLALLFFKSRWKAFCDAKAPIIKEAENIMLPFTIKHEDAGSSQSLLVVAGQHTYQIAPGQELQLTISDPHTRIQMMECVYTPGDAPLKVHQYEMAQQPAVGDPAAQDTEIFKGVSETADAESDTDK